MIGGQFAQNCTEPMVRKQQVVTGATAGVHPGDRGLQFVISDVYSCMDRRKHKTSVFYLLSTHH